MGVEASPVNTLENNPLKFNSTASCSTIGLSALVYPKSQADFAVHKELCATAATLIAVPC